MVEMSRIDTVKKALQQVHSYQQFLELVPYPQDAEDAWAYGVEREVLSDAMLAIAILSLRKLDDFLKCTKSHAGDIVAKDVGVDALEVLDGRDRLLDDHERGQVNKTVAHLTNDGFIDSSSYDEHWGSVVERCSPALEKLSQKIAKLEAQNADP